MQLDWHVTKETQRGQYWQAEYEAYDTPAGPAIATAKVEPDVYFPGWFTYETWLHDPYLEAAGACYYKKLAYGSNGDIDYCFNVCEDFGVRETTACLKNIDIQFLYQDALPKLAMKYLEDNGFDVEQLTPFDRTTMRAYILEGGYEPATVDLWLNDDLTIGMGYT